jgi:hypothetical protein
MCDVQNRLMLRPAHAYGLVAVVLLIGSLAACTHQSALLNRAAQLRVGMTEAQVFEIMGKPDTVGAPSPDTKGVSWSERIRPTTGGRSLVETVTAEIYRGYLVSDWRNVNKLQIEEAKRAVDKRLASESRP